MGMLIILGCISANAMYKRTLRGKSITYSTGCNTSLSRVYCLGLANDLAQPNASGSLGAATLRPLKAATYHICSAFIKEHATEWTR